MTRMFSTAIAAGVLILSADANALRMGLRTQATAPPFKGVFEAVNYPEDLGLNDVYFVSLDVGYVAGQAGTILKTTSGGAKWDVQLGGDPQSGAKAIEDLRFIDEQHGWAIQQAGSGQASVLKTTDGESWQLAGSINEHYADYTFTSPTSGVYLFSEKIFSTEDGGKSWRQTAECQYKGEVQGLTRTIPCEFYKVSFPSPNVGYALGTTRNPYLAVVFKTTDQGATWSVASTIEEDNGRNGEISFLDENTGYVRGYSGKFFRTTDGGQTWTGVAGMTFRDNSEIRFADPEVGWAIGHNWVGITTVAHRTLVYTTTAGRLWSSREIPLPAGVRAFSMPRRDRAYVVGDHGMVYRYRVVPATETVAKSIPAPAMPVFETPLDDQLEKLDTQLDALQKAGGGDAAVLTQQLTAIEATVTAASTEAPKFAGKYRNLNLLLVGVEMSGDLLKQVQSLKESIQAMKPATGRQSAPMAALPEVREKSKALVQMVRGFVQK